MHKNTGKKKHQGFIVRSKASKGAQFTERSHSHDFALTNHSTLNSQFEKSPGEIKKIHRESILDVEKIDEEVHYNSDIYLKYEIMKRPAVKYQQCQHVAIQVRKPSPKAESPSKQQQKRTQQSRYDNKRQVLLLNIHGSFELHRFQQLYNILKNILISFQIDEIETLKSIRPYIYFVTKENVDNVSQLKFIPNKREIIKQSFAIEREAMLVICFAVATNRFQALKNYCSNLLKYAFENHLVVLNLLTQENNEYVEHLLIENHKEHLKGKGFDFIRSTNETMTTLIVKVSKNDPLFAGQFCKIIENYSNNSVKAELYSLLTFFSFYLRASKANDIIPFLSAAPGPYIVDQPQLQYTLVIDFVKIFIDSSVPIRKQLKKDHLLIRPYAQYFLNQMSKYFQVVSFSDCLPIECNKIINKVDEKRCVKYRLYKYHIDESRKKDVDKIGRDTDRTILLDTTQSLTIDNLLLIHPWKGQSNDAILAEICPLLATIPVKKLSALSSLQKIKQGITRNASLGLKYINCGLSL